MSKPSVKFCTRCEQDKPVDEFHRRARSADGRTPWCKSCAAAYALDYKRRNPEKAAASRRAWKAANPERIRATEAARYQRNRDEILARNKAHYEANRDRYLEQRRRYYQESREEHLARGAAWRAANIETARAMVRAWNKAHPEAALRSRALRRAAMVEPVSAEELRNLWTGDCALCGDVIDEQLVFPNPGSKSVDHIIALAVGGAHAIDNLQWTHLICNQRKGARPGLTAGEQPACDIQSAGRQQQEPEPADHRAHVWRSL